ncbi:putative RNA-binding protein [Vanrija pseudolonga]|uniref:U4/U6 snRNA-associated-splicing factor PRP24 n=1 Tax=Vanrija pseudolonga TaxID=143232 RepID=A0AAF0XZ94_9TREE|nr:purtative RNA-binding protein [Vanrija pseudolonga]
MDVDSTVEAQADPQALVNELGELLAELEGKPTNVRLLRRQLELMLELDMIDEATGVLDSVLSLTFLGEQVWLRLINAKTKLSVQPLTLEGFADILELYSKAENDYLSAAVLEHHINFILQAAGAASTDDSADEPWTVDAEVAEYLNTESVRDQLKGAVHRGIGLLSNSQQLWQLWRDWEVSLLGSLEGEEKSEQINHIHEMYLERLQTPHSTMAETSGAYSSFCSEYSPDEYEGRLVAATEASQNAQWKWSSERRHAKTRADFEESLAYSTDVAQQAQVLLGYVDWETDPFAKKPKGKKGPKVDVTLTAAAFERTVVVYGNAAFTAEDASFGKDSTVETQLVETAAAYKTAEALVWSRYVDWMAESGALDRDQRDLVVDRATRACPTSSELWVHKLNDLEAEVDVPEIESTAEKARSLVVANGQPVSALVDILYAHAAILARRNRSLDGSLEHPVFQFLTEAVETVTAVFKSGDPSLRLEKYFIAWAEASSPELIPGVIAVLEKPIRARLSSYQWAILRADAQARTGDLEAARHVYESAIQRTDLDWPEAVYEAFILFENVYGDLDTLLKARRSIAREQQKVNRRRQKQAEQTQQAALEAYQAEAAAAAAAAPTETQGEVTTAPAADAADVVLTESTEAPTNGAPEKQAEDAEVHQKRDRENTTVLVSGLKKGTHEDRLRSFFEAVGKIRECTLLPGEETDSALVEFQFADDVPAALDKDRKKIDGHEVHVAMLWRSTLFVTNFPANSDDASLRKLFGQYGGILQTRWPSRKYGDARRFCYITMESPAVAQDALNLNQFKIDGGHPMTVLISDPSAKTKRSDASKSTLFVGGLNAKTTEHDVRGLFSKYGTLLGIKLGWDPVKRICKGFAFVDLSKDAEAKAALELNGTQYRGKYLKVELSDPNHANKKKAPRPAGSAPDASGAREASERRSRQVRLYGLPEGSEEGLLQQALEKIVPVKRLEIFRSSHEALVELQSQSDAGLLLMRTEPFEFNGATLRIGDQSERAKPSAPGGEAAAPAASAPQSSLAFAPRARKPAKSLGKAYQPPKKAAATAASVPTTGGQGQDSFRQFMTATNEKRKTNLDAKIAEKRGPEDEPEGEGEAKRAKKD